MASACGTVWNPEAPGSYIIIYIGNSPLTMSGGYRRLQIAESDARLALEIARAELNQHKRNELGTI